MRVRSAHVACLLLLLSAFGAADAPAQAVIPGRAGVVAQVLRLQASALQMGRPVAALASSTYEQERGAAGTSLRADLPWAMRPPAAHTLARHAVSGSGL